MSQNIKYDPDHLRIPIGPGKIHPLGEFPSIACCDTAQRRSRGGVMSGDRLSGFFPLTRYRAK